MFEEAAGVLLPDHPQNRLIYRYCLHQARVLHELFRSCSMLQNPAARCDLDEVLSSYDLGPRTPDEHEQFLFEFGDSLLGAWDDWTNTSQPTG